MSWIEIYPISNLPLEGEHIAVWRGDHEYTNSAITYSQAVPTVAFLSYVPDSDKITVWGDLTGGYLKTEIYDVDGNLLDSDETTATEIHSKVDPLTECSLSDLTAKDRAYVKIYLKADTSVTRVCINKIRILMVREAGWEEIFPMASNWTEISPTAS